MDELEERLKKVLRQEAERIENPIRCYINGAPCKDCQPCCTHRRKEEVRIYGRERGTYPGIPKSEPREI